MNFEGLKRRGFSQPQIQAVKAMHKLLYRDGLTLDESLKAIQQLGMVDASLDSVVSLMTSFLANVSPQRGIIR